MNKSLRSELLQLLITLIILVAMGYGLFQLKFGEIVTSSSTVEMITQKVIPTLFEVALLFLFFKVAYYLIITIGLTRIGKNLFGKHVQKVKKILDVAWWIVFAIMALLLIVDDPGTVITSAGLVGLGLTVALQKPIMNFVGWGTIVFQDVYEEGDRIKIGSVRGDVKEIQVMNTVLWSLLETSDQRSQKILTIPNEFVLSQEVENYTKSSNYVLEEMLISITYESDYEKAMHLLEKIIRRKIASNITQYIKIKKQDHVRVKRVLSSLVKKRAEKEELKKETDDIQKEIAELQTLSEEFKPKIRLEMADSALILVAQFLTPYDAIKRTRTSINLAFLESISKDDKNIEVAYPHMQLVFDDRMKKILKK